MNDVGQIGGLGDPPLCNGDARKGQSAMPSVGRRPFATTVLGRNAVGHADTDHSAIVWVSPHGRSHRGGRDFVNITGTVQRKAHEISRSLKMGPRFNSRPWGDRGDAGLGHNQGFY